MEEPAAILFDKIDCNGRFGRFFAPTKFGISNDYHETSYEIEYPMPAVGRLRMLANANTYVEDK